MQPKLFSLHYLPSVSWVAAYLHTETAYLEAFENFVKSSGRNRCVIGTASGKQLLTIPLKGGRDHHRLYSETIIDNSQPWQQKHWSSIVTAYNSTPFFEYYASYFQSHYTAKFDSLFAFNSELLRTILRVLKVNKELVLTPVYQKQPESLLDLRSNIVIADEKKLPRYYQIFEERNGFLPNLSIIDLIFHLGPAAKDYLYAIQL